MSFNKITIGLAAPLLILAHVEWIKRVQRTVPEPYLDEVFHTPQANAFWQGKWSHWDDKITTPPGVYLWSILTSKLYWADTAQSQVLSAHQTRSTNSVLPYMLAICILVLERSAGRVSATVWVSPRQLCIFAFPLVFFFSGLYYTDVFSALTVMCTYAFWQSSLRYRGLTKLSLQIMNLLSGLLSLASRQTNVFWVAIFLGGLQVVHTIKQKARVHDPLISEAYFEDLFTMLLSLATSALSAIPDLLLDLWPQLALLLSFAGFVIWNGGVVLGDKSNHVATIHLPQMLYIWPFILFFSWPALLPYLARPKTLLRQIPRYWLAIPALLGIAAVVHYNTIVHPFLLADNRHYTFYVFKILRNRPWLWYALVPVYAASAWLSIIALGGIPEDTTQKRTGPGKVSRQKPVKRDDHVQDKGDHLSFLLVWLISTSLSLITAPLVEPRYFIVPWLIWRLHVPQCTGGSAGDSTTTKERGQISLATVAKGGVWVEMLWYMAINLATCRLFLEHEFRWPHSPSEMQRFMW